MPFKPAVYTTLLQLRKAEELRRQLISAQEALQRESSRATEAEMALGR